MVSGLTSKPGTIGLQAGGSCHVVYANDRDPGTGQWAPHGHEGKTASVDPTIAKDESGHPIRHAFSRAIPTAQCMSCHMHQPNMFPNSYLGYTMWDYESDAPNMWPEEQKYPTSAEIREVNERNPNGAGSPRGKWADYTSRPFLSGITSTRNTQFADYHGHGWNFRGHLPEGPEGAFADEEGNIALTDDPDKIPKSGAHVIDSRRCGNALRGLSLRPGLPRERSSLYGSGERR